MEEIIESYEREHYEVNNIKNFESSESDLDIVELNEA
jgi:hypothetical protein